MRMDASGAFHTCPRATHVVYQILGGKMDGVKKSILELDYG
jgi:hypothetical protein